MQNLKNGDDFTPKTKSKITMSSFREIGQVTNDWLDVLKHYLGSFRLDDEFTLPEQPNTRYKVEFHDNDPQMTGFLPEYRVLIRKPNRKPVSYNAFQFVQDLKLKSRKETTKIIDQEMNLGLFY